MSCPNRISYTLRRGDTFYKIAQRYHTTVEILQCENPHMNPGALMIGEVITICPGLTQMSEQPAAYAPMPSPVPVPESGHTPTPIPMAAPAPTPITVPMPAQRTASVPAPAPVPMPMQIPPMPVEYTPNPVVREDIKAIPMPRELHTPAHTGSHNSRDTMRTLWEHQRLWTYALAVSVIDGLPDMQAVSRRLMRNNSDMAAMFESHAGPGAVKEISSMMDRNQMFLIQLAQALKGGSQQAEEDAWKRFRESTEQLIGFLCKSQPRFNCDMLKEAFTRYIELVRHMLTMRAKKDYQAAIEAVDKLGYVSMELADMLS